MQRIALKTYIKFKEKELGEISEILCFASEFTDHFIIHAECSDELEIHNYYQ